MIAQATFIEHRMTTDAAHRLWSVYGDLIEDIHGNFMDDQRLWQSIRIMGEVAADGDRNNSLAEGRSLRTRLASGLTEGTADCDMFNEAYNGRMAALERENKKR